MPRAEPQAGLPPLPPPLPPPGSPASEHPNPYAAQAERIDGEGNEPADAPLPEPPASVMPTLCPEPAALATQCVRPMEALARAAGLDHVT